MTYTINEGLLPKLKARVGVLQTKIEKDSRGNGTLTYTESEPYAKDDEYVVDIDIEATYKVGDYEFVASLEYNPTTKQNLIKKVSDDVEVPKMYRDRNVCDHCKTHRNRVHTVLLKSKETGEYIQVGKSCIKDFVGIDLSCYASYLSCFTTIEQYIEHIERSTPSFCRKRAFKVEDILLQTLEYVERFGYYSKKQENESHEATSSCVWHAINHTTSYYGEDYTEYDITEKSRDKLLKVLEYLSETLDDSDYVNNLKILAQNSYVQAENFGLVVSLVGWYLRAIRKDKERQAKPSEYLGKEGERITITATPECLYQYSTDFGNVYLYKFNVDGNIAVWKASRAIGNKEVTLKGTIKATQLYDGIKQTVLTRCRVQ